MKVLFVCSQGMSSTIAVNSLKKEAEKNEVEMEVLAVSTQAFEEELAKGYDIAMVAPQIKHRFKLLKEFADKANVPCEVIETMAYSPLGGPKLFAQVMKLNEK